VNGVGNGNEGTDRVNETSGAQPRTEKASRVARLDESGYQGRTRHELCSRSAVESSPKNRGLKEEERAKGQGTQDEKTELEDGEQGSSEETGWTAGQRQEGSVLQIGACG